MSHDLFDQLTVLVFNLDVRQWHRLMVVADLIGDLGHTGDDRVGTRLLASDDHVLRDQRT